MIAALSVYSDTCQLFSSIDELGNPPNNRAYIHATSTWDGVQLILGIITTMQRPVR